MAKKRRKPLDISDRKDYNNRINPKALREKLPAPRHSCQRADGTGCNRPQENEELRTAFSSAVPNHRRSGPVTRRNEVDRFSRSDSGGTVGYFVSPRLFSSQEESSRFYFPFFGGGENRRWLCRGFAIHQSDFIGQEYAVTRLLAIIRFSLAAPLGSSASIHQ